MKIDSQASEKAAVREYVVPACEILSVGLQSLVCNSETEHVGETEGEW